MDLIGFVLPPLQVGRALWIVVAAAATLVAAWTFQWFGITPCELCHAER
jgi:disulfide bond formation protein DsbB